MRQKFAKKNQLRNDYRIVLFRRWNNTIKFERFYARNFVRFFFVLFCFVLPTDSPDINGETQLSSDFHNMKMTERRQNSWFQQVRRQYKSEKHILLVGNYSRYRERKQSQWGRMKKLLYVLEVNFTSHKSSLLCRAQNDGANRKRPWKAIGVNGPRNMIFQIYF